MSGAWIEVFKTGTHTSGNGVVKTYTEDDLEKIAVMYNSQKNHEAPLVLGHPTTDDPAYGWTKELKSAGSKLLAYVDQVSDKIVDAVKNGDYKKVSIAIYPDGLLRHIGLLGAVPPAVKGLASVQFAEGIEFEEYIWVTDETRMPTVARILSGIRDFIIDKFDLETADKLIDKSDLSYLATQVSSNMITLDDQNKVAKLATVNFNEEEIMQKEFDDKIAAIESKFETQFSEVKSQFDTVKAGLDQITELVNTQAKAALDKTQMSAFETAKQSFAAFAENLCKEGKILPAEKDSIVDEYADLLTAENTLTFAEGSVKPSEKMKKRLEGRPVVFAAKGYTFADPNKVGSKDAKAIEIPVAFAEMGDKVDASSVDLDKKIREYAETNKVSYEEAAAAYGAA